MTDSLTASVARLYRAGSEYSQESKKLRQAVDSLITWLLEHERADVSLPNNCTVWHDGTFTKNLSSQASDFHFQVRRGSEHSRSNLQGFARLIADGFLEQVAEQLAQESVVFEKASSQLDSFLQQN